MPYATCPACNADVKYPKDADVGSTATCPDCDEVFVPPKLKPKAKKPKKYNPETDEDTYKVGRATSQQDEKDKSRKADAAMRGARAKEAQRKAERQPMKWWEGPEVWLLIFALGTGVGLPFGLWLARNWQKMSDTKVYWIFIVLIAVGIASVGLGGSAWAWLRRNNDRMGP